MLIVLFAFFTWLLLRIFIPYLSLHLPDCPNERSSHPHPIPRGGGFAFVFPVSVFSACILFAGGVSGPALLPLLVFPLSLVGLFDDRFNLSASFRYTVHVVTSVLLLSLSPLVQPLGLAFISGVWPLFPILIFLVIAVTAVINFTNFMDGLDGLVSGCLIFSLIPLSVVLDSPWVVWALEGSLLGFLFWNWSPARVFMGDVGSIFLGSIFVIIIYSQDNIMEGIKYLSLG